MADETNAAAPAAGEGTATPAPDAGISRDEIRTIVAGIVSATLKKAVPDAIGGALKAFTETELAPIKARLSEPAKTPETQTPKAEQAGGPDPFVVELQAKIAKLEADGKAAREAAAAERRKALQSKAYSDLRQQLNGKVKPEAVDILADVLRARKLVSYDDDGNVKLKVLHAPVRGMAEEEAELPLSEALPIFLKSKEASMFLPAPSTGAGPGAKPAMNAVRPDGRPMSPAEAFEALGFGSLEDNL